MKSIRFNETRWTYKRNSTLLDITVQVIPNPNLAQFPQENYALRDVYVQFLVSRFSFQRNPIFFMSH